jgi:hypothetical protein
MATPQVKATLIDAQTGAALGTTKMSLSPAHRPFRTMLGATDGE